jgi:hypothetical protein
MHFLQQFGTPIGGPQNGVPKKDGNNLGCFHVVFYCSGIKQNEPPQTEQLVFHFFSVFSVISV